MQFHQNHEVTTKVPNEHAVQPEYSTHLTASGTLVVRAAHRQGACHQPDSVSPAGLCCDAQMFDGRAVYLHAQDFFGKYNAKSHYLRLLRLDRSRNSLLPVVWQSYP